MFGAMGAVVLGFEQTTVSDHSAKGRARVDFLSTLILILIFVQIACGGAGGISVEFWFPPV